MLITHTQINRLKYDFRIQGGFEMCKSIKISISKIWLKNNTYHIWVRESNNQIGMLLILFLLFWAFKFHNEHMHSNSVAFNFYLIRFSIPEKVWQFSNLNKTNWNKPLELRHIIKQPRFFFWYRTDHFIKIQCKKW